MHVCDRIVTPKTMASIAARMVNMAGMCVTPQLTSKENN